MCIKNIILLLAFTMFVSNSVLACRVALTFINNSRHNPITVDLSSSSRNLFKNGSIYCYSDTGNSIDCPLNVLTNRKTFDIIANDKNIKCTNESHSIVINDKDFIIGDNTGIDIDNNIRATSKSCTANTDKSFICRVIFTDK